MAKREAVLLALTRGATISRACEIAGVPANTVYGWRKDDRDFDDAVLEQRRIGKELLADKGIAAVEEIIADRGHKDRFAASKWANERVEGQAATRIEVVGRIQHEARLTLADLVQHARVELPIVEGSLTGSRRSLSAAGAVLAEAGDGERAASGVPVEAGS